MNLIDLKETYFNKLSQIEDEMVHFLLSNYLKHNASEKDIDDSLQQHLHRRSRFFINTILPWINDFKTLQHAKVLEIGPGTGSATAPTAMATKHVYAYDISARSANVAIVRCEALDIKNVTISVYDPDAILAQITDVHRDNKPDIVLMFAVLEHQKLEERLTTLKTCWDILKDDGLLVIGDTPNRLVYRHGHTSRMPFFDMVPDTLMSHFLDQASNATFVNSWQKWIRDGLPDDDIQDRIDRWGRGVSFHEFLVAVGPMEDFVLGEGLEKSLVRAMPINLEESLLMRFLARELPDIPLGFGRQSLYLILRKSGNVKNNKKWDEDLVRGLLRGI